MTTDNGALVAPTQPPPASIVPAPRRTTLPSLIGQLCGVLRHDARLCAELRRAPPGAQTPAYWRLAVACIEPAGWLAANGTPSDEAWCVVLGVLAELAGLHLKRTSLGTALAGARASEMRVTQLCRAEGQNLWHATRAAARLLGSIGARCDHAELAALVLSDEAPEQERARSRRRIAWDYYRFLGRERE